MLLSYCSKSGFSKNCWNGQVREGGNFKKRDLMSLITTMATSTAGEISAVRTAKTVRLSSIDKMVVDEGKEAVFHLPKELYERSGYRGVSDRVLFRQEIVNGGKYIIPIKNDHLDTKDQELQCFMTYW
jgi:hypothetical protein